MRIMPRSGREAANFIVSSYNIFSFIILNVKTVCEER